MIWCHFNESIAVRAIYSSTLLENSKKTDIYLAIIQQISTFLSRTVFVVVVVVSFRSFYQTVFRVISSYLWIPNCRCDNINSTNSANYGRLVWLIVVLISVALFTISFHTLQIDSGFDDDEWLIDGQCSSCNWIPCVIYRNGEKNRLTFFFHCALRNKYHLSAICFFSSSSLLRYSLRFTQNATSQLYYHISISCNKSMV